MTVLLHTLDEKNLLDLLPMVRAFHKLEQIELTDADREKSIRYLLEQKDLGEIWLIKENTEIIGYIVLCVSYSIEFSGLDAFVDEFYIRVESRGQGIGSKVLILLKNEARRMNVRAIHLEVDRSNDRARQLYTNANFTERDKYVIMSTLLS